MARLPMPGDLLRLTERGYAALELALGLVPRAAALVGQLESITGRAEAALDGLDRTRQSADQLVERAGGLIDGLEPTLNRLMPILEQLASTTTPAEVDAVVRLLNMMPELVERMHKEILPILASLSSVGPDIRELLDTMKEFTTALGALPGMGRVRRRVEEHEAE